MKRPPDSEQLDNLRQLDDVLDKLGKLVRNCLASKKVTRDDEEAHDSLMREAQVLYGRVRSVVGTMVIARGGIQRDTFQDILGTPSVSNFVNDGYAVGFWFESLKASRSGVGQAIGRVEEMRRQGRLGLTPEVVGRYRGLINALERIRRAAITAFEWATRPFHLLDPFLRIAERSPGVRFLILVGEVAGGVVIVVVILAAVVTAIR